MKPNFEHWLRQVKEIALSALFSDDYLLVRLALKGGTAIDMSLRGGLQRSSLDIDLSIEGDFELPLEQLRARIEKSLDVRFKEIGYQVFDVKLAEKPRPHPTPSWPAFWGGYRCEFRLAQTALASQFSLADLRRRSETLGEKNKRAFKIDISKHEHIGGAVRACQLEDGTSIFVYSPRLLVAEKLRALCQQMPEYPHGHRTPRARDYFDITGLLDAEPDVAPDAEFADLLREVFKAKDVPLEWLESLGQPQVVDFHRQDFHDRVAATVPTTYTLRPFDNYVKRVVDFIGLLPSADASPAALPDPATTPR